MRYYKKSGRIYLSADEVARVIAYKNNYSEAFCIGEIFTQNMFDGDECWDEISPGNDFKIDKPYDNYGIKKWWGPFIIFDSTEEYARDMREFLEKYKTVKDVLNNL